MNENGRLFEAGADGRVPDRLPRPARLRGDRPGAPRDPRPFFLSLTFPAPHSGTPVELRRPAVAAHARRPRPATATRSRTSRCHGRRTSAGPTATASPRSWRTAAASARRTWPRSRRTTSRSWSRCCPWTTRWDGWSDALTRHRRAGQHADHLHLGQRLLPRRAPGALGEGAALRAGHPRPAHHARARGSRGPPPGSWWATWTWPPRSWTPRGPSPGRVQDGRSLFGPAARPHPRAGPRARARERPRREQRAPVPGAAKQPLPLRPPRHHGRVRALRPAQGPFELRNLEDSDRYAGIRRAPARRLRALQRCRGRGCFKSKPSVRVAARQVRPKRKKRRRRTRGNQSCVVPRPAAVPVRQGRPAGGVGALLGRLAPAGLVAPAPVHRAREAHEAASRPPVDHAGARGHRRRPRGHRRPQR